MEPALPQLADILAATDVLSRSDATNTVVKVNEKMVVKYGHQVPLLEARNLSWLHAESEVPVPKVFGTHTEPNGGRNFIVMELIAGQTLESIMDDLTAEEKARICCKIREALDSLRSVPSPGYLGSLDRQPCFDGLFYTGDEPDPAIAGPFDTESAMNRGILRIMAQRVPAAYLQLVQDLMQRSLVNHRTVFTHADLQPKNIMVQRLDTDAEGNADFAIKIIDWEFSGWYPEYWEFCNANVAARFRPQWLEMMQSILPTPHEEYAVIELVRSILMY